MLLNAENCSKPFHSRILSRGKIVIKIKYLKYTQCPRCSPEIRRLRDGERSIDVDCDEGRV